MRETRQEARGRSALSVACLHSTEQITNSRKVLVSPVYQALAAYCRKTEPHVRLSRHSEYQATRMPLRLRVLSKWVTLPILESFGLIAALLKVALKIAHPNKVFGPPLWAEPALELTLRFAVVGLVLSAYPS